MSPNPLHVIAAPRARVTVLVVVALALSGFVAACSSGTGGSAASSIKPATTSTAAGADTTTTVKQPTTTTTEARTTTTAAKSTTTTADGPTTSTSDAPTTSSSTSSTAAPTTTTRPSTTTSVAPTSAPTTLVGEEVSAEAKKMPWLAIGVLGALIALIIVVMARRRSERSTWWSDVDGVGRQGQALVDLGAAGPASADAQQQVAHWATLEQRTVDLAAAVTASAAGAPDDAARAVLTNLDQAVGTYLAALRTARTLRIGPPAPTAQQLQFADAESAQRLANVRGVLGQLDQLVAPHR